MIRSGILKPMSLSDDEGRRLRIAHFVPVELQRLGFQHNAIFSELADRGLKPITDGARQVQPWCRWRGTSTYLDCVAFADRSAKAIPTGKDLNLEHVTPGQFYSASVIFFGQALLDNIAVWLCEALPLSVRGGERHFLSTQFKRELKKREPSSAGIIAAHEPFVKEVNTYRQVWIHSLAGGAMPISDISPFENPETANKYLGVPIEPAINFDQKNYLKRIEQCAMRHAGHYLYRIGDFTGRIFNAASVFYLDWLRFALDHIRR